MHTDAFAHFLYGREGVPKFGNSGYIAIIFHSVARCVSYDLFGGRLSQKNIYADVHDVKRLSTDA